MANLMEVGTRAQYDALKVKNNKVLYWLTDTQEIYMGDKRYATGKEATEDKSGLMSPEDKQLLLALADLVSNNMGVATLASDFMVEGTPVVMAGGGQPVVAADTWVADKEHYDWYNQYHDTNYSRIDANKNIALDKGQINLTEESYAQFVPFEMERYYDGIDLANMTLSLIYVTKDGYEGAGEIVNVEYGASAIRFAWLIDEKVTHIAGDIKFEISARGFVANAVGDVVKAYVWKSKTGIGLSVQQALTSGRNIKLDDSWMTELVETVAERIAEKVADQIATAEIDKEAAKAQAAADRAEEAADRAEGAVVEGLGDVTSEIEAVNARVDTLTTTLNSTTNRLDEEIARVDNSIPGNVSQLNNDVGYLTEHQSLEDYAKKSELPVIPTKVSAFENDAGYLTEHQSLANYATKAYVQTEIAKVDVSDQLKDYAKKTDLEGLATEEYVNTKIEEADISSKLADYTTHEELQEAIDSVDVSEQLKDYATHAEMEQAIAEVDVSEQLQDYAKSADVYDKAAVDSKDAVIQSGVDTNTQNIGNLSTAVTNLQQQVNSIKVDQQYTYDVAYNDVEDPDVGENVFVFYEIENEGLETEVRTPKQKFTIVGGGGGGGTSSSLKIEYITTTPIVATMEDKVVIKYRFTGTDSSGDNVMEGDAVWKVGSQIVATNTAIYGDNEFDITDYLSLGTQKVNLTITDAAGSLVTKTWTVQKVDVRIESSFNDKLTYPLGTISFDYTPYGAISKTVHFKIDDVEVGTVATTASGIPATYTLPTQTHGAHLVEVYITATINSNEIESNHIYKDVIWYDSTSDVPVIGTVYQNFTARQYEATNISYVVYDPNTSTPTVTRAVDGEIVGTNVMDSSEGVWQYKTDEIGVHTLTITCGSTVKTLTANIEKLDIDVQPVAGGLMFDFNPSGKSNSDEDRLWTYGEGDNKVSMVVSDNFDWVNGGYQIDENGDQYFCIKSGTTATIDYKLFSDDCKKTGKEFKVVFKTANVKNRDTSFLTCMDNGIGLDMQVQAAYVYSSNDNLYSPYCEDDVIEFEFNINKDTDIPMVLTYEDGVANRPMIYASDTSFMQKDAQIITIGSENCDVYIYRMKAYNVSLSDTGILSNFIADARSADEMIDRYNRNQIYDENNNLTPEILAQKCPWLRVIKVDAPWFTNDKSNKVDDTTVTMIYRNGDAILDNWTCTGAQHSGQGTSSNEYGYAARNMDLIMDGDSALFTLGDGVTTSKTITLTRNSTPTDYLNVKTNVASSENQNNALMTMRFNEYQPYTRTARLRDSKIRDCMEFYNCVVFLREHNEDISTHREFLDTEWHYYALGNVGDSKKTDDTRVNDKNDPKEFCIEVMDYNVALAEFPTGYTDEEGNKVICPESEWKEGNTAYDYLYADYKYKDGKFKSFGSESYEFRYEKKGITELEREANINAWREAYKFVVTTDDATFKSDFNKYFVQDSILYFYLFTERYTLVDNRAKNLFIHYGKVWYTTAEAQSFKEEFGVEIPAEYINEEQATFNEGYRFDLTFGYDFDTCLGIDNTGKLVITYGKEDIDYYTDDDPSSGYIYRAAESTFFRRIRNLFSSELEALYVDRESANAWSSDGLINQFDAAQKEFPEEIWRLDIQRKYLRTYQGVSIDNSIAGTANPRFLTEMLNGRKRYQRRMFERNQELYFATKYFGNKATQDQIMMRFNNPVGAVVKQDFTLYLTPYSDMYIAVKFGNVTPTNFRAKAGVEYTIPYGIAADSADITLIYGASFIQAIGDLSKCYVGDNDFSKATRLQRLTVGSNVEGYTNNFMTKITLGSNKLLEYLDIRNVTGLSSVVDLSQCNNLTELYAENCGATGVIFANGGKLQKAHIPDVISLTAKNLKNLEEFESAGYTKLQTLVVENTPFINTYEIVNAADNLTTVRLIGMDWDSSYGITEPSIFSRLLTLRGIDGEGYESLTSVLAGYAFVTMMREKLLADYNAAWNDLEFGYNTLIQQFTVTFQNDDGTVLDVQYVDKGEKPVDPVTREENPIPTPTKESTVSTDFTYAGWDGSFIAVFSNQTYTATYTESIRQYTVKYVSMGTTLQESQGNYGEMIPYEGDIPTYTAEETGYRFYLFKKWDKSGLVTGNKTINAVYDSFEYSDGYFNTKDFSELTPVELYAMVQMGLHTSTIETGDSIGISLGNDFEYPDIESQLIVSEKTALTGSNYIDTGLKLFEEDRSFVLAFDYATASDCANNGTVLQCYSDNGARGFKIQKSSTNIQVSWNVSSTIVSQNGKREMVVIRHIKGDDNLYIYAANAEDDYNKGVITYKKLENTLEVLHDSPLVFGCARSDDGVYENYAKGAIYWAKIWWVDLGEKACKELASYLHEDMNLIVAGTRRFYLANVSNKRSAITFVADKPLHNNLRITTDAYSKSWPDADLNGYLNEKVYKGLPVQWRLLVKQCVIKSLGGKTSTEIVEDNSYIYLPAAADMGASDSSGTTLTDVPYVNEISPANGALPLFTDNNSRLLADSNGKNVDYWLRTPCPKGPSWQYSISNTGAVYSYQSPYSDVISSSEERYIYARIMLSI